MDSKQVKKKFYGAARGVGATRGAYRSHSNWWMARTAAFRSGADGTHWAIVPPSCRDRLFILFVIIPKAGGGAWSVPPKRFLERYKVCLVQLVVQKIKQGLLRSSSDVFSTGMSFILNVWNWNSLDGVHKKTGEEFRSFCYCEIFVKPTFVQVRVYCSMPYRACWYC